MKWFTKMLGKGKKKKAGFTLIELMIVIIIVGILAAIAVPIYSGFVKRARSSEAKATVGAIRTGELVYHAEHTAWIITTGSNNTTILKLLGIDLTKNRWFNAPDTATTMTIDWDTGVGTGGDTTGVTLMGVLPPIDGIGAKIQFWSGELFYTTDGGTWAEGD